MERRSAVVSLIVWPGCAFHQVFGDMRPPCFKVTAIFQKETNMASKAKMIGSTDPQAETAVEERKDLLDSTREEEIRNRAYEIYLQRGGQAG